MTRRIPLTLMLMLVLWLPTYTAAPLGEHSVENDEVRLSMAKAEFDWFTATQASIPFELLGWATEGFEERACVRFENIGTIEVHQPTWLWYDIYDAQDRLVYSYRHWQSAVDTLQPGESRQACWIGQMTDYDGASQWYGESVVPPGEYRSTWTYWVGDAWPPTEISIPFALVDESGLYGLGSE